MTPLLPLLLLAHAPGAAFTAAPVRSLRLPEPPVSPSGPGELRLRPDAAAYLVRPGVQLEGRFEGDLVAPPTDPGRTLIRVTLRTPLLAQDGRTVLLPVGTQLLGQVHLLRGDYRFAGFQSLVLPGGQALVTPEGGFRLGVGPSVPFQEGGRVPLTVARTLRMEAFGR